MLAAAFDRKRVMGKCGLEVSDRCMVAAGEARSALGWLLPFDLCSATGCYRPNAASELRDLASRKQSRAHEEAGSSKWDYFSLMCK